MNNHTPSPKQIAEDPIVTKPNHNNRTDEPTEVVELSHATLTDSPPTPKVNNHDQNDDADIAIQNKYSPPPQSRAHVWNRDARTGASRYRARGKGRGVTGSRLSN